MRKPNTLYRLFRSQTCIVAIWDENGHYRKMRFFDYPKKEVIWLLRNKYNVSVPHEYY